MQGKKGTEKWVAAIALAALLGACGRGAPTAARPAGLVTKAPTQLGQAWAGAGATLPVGGFAGMAGAIKPGTTADGGRGQALLAQVRQVLQSCQTFSAEVDATSTGMWKAGERQGAERTITVGYRITWQRPAKFRAEVTKSPSSIEEGATMVTTDGQNITARAKGILGFLAISAKANDLRISNARKHTFDQFNPNTQMARMTGPSAVWTVLQEGRSPQGTPVVRCAIDGVPRLDGEIDREEVTFDMATQGMVSLTAFAKGRKVIDYSFSRFQWNTKVAPGSFTL